jgi:hypothetical protein
MQNFDGTFKCFPLYPTELPAANAPAFLLRLRSGTSSYHEALKPNRGDQVLTAGTLTTMVQVLAKKYGFLGSVEATRLQHAAAFAPTQQVTAPT